ncbi:MAG: methanogenesis marker 7 protein [Archaeoglobi archaeon]|jgi:putative methanogenesis marker protein 7|nr:MAG: methanogenesis marker 7 protein [Archaeoglobi archaeon]TDA30824.1 MAG: methanogenesis marker 7 protein [Archaeoglobi archaeon]
MIPLIFNGGVYGHQEFEDLVYDLGGFVIMKNFAQTEVTIFFIVPEEDVERVKEKALELKAELREAPLAGSEVAVVVPTISIYHLPHHSCDVAEYLRRKGAKTNMVGLSRGVGKRLARLTAFERDLINEHDIAVFLFGNFRECVSEKLGKMLREITIPVVATGFPKIEPPEGVEYVPNLGRIVGKFSRDSDIELLENVAKAVEKQVEKKRRIFERFEVPPYYLKVEIENQIPEIEESPSPAPVTVKLDGLRVKLPYEKFAEKIRNVRILDFKLGDICNVLPSVIEGHTLVRFWSAF